MTADEIMTTALGVAVGLVAAGIITWALSYVVPDVSSSDTAPTAVSKALTTLSQDANNNRIV